MSQNTVILIGIGVFILDIIGLLLIGFGNKRLWIWVGIFLLAVPGTDMWGYVISYYSEKYSKNFEIIGYIIVWISIIIFVILGSLISRKLGGVKTLGISEFFDFLFKRS